jgi:hypothetical protein
LNALLKLQDPLALKTLAEAIHSADPDAAFQAVSLSGQYRVKAVVNDVLSKIKRTIFFETDYAANEELIKALGEIGDPRAIRDLEKIARTTWSFHPGALIHMKECLFESLDRYPPDSITGLLVIGQRSNNEKIMRACKKLAERK